MVKQGLPLGAQSFSALRQTNKIYVDKTEQIYELCRDPLTAYFLSRPRRFGKSLLTTTMESLFRYGLRDFKGLAIEKLWTDKTYTVLRLDFSGAGVFSDIETFQFRMTRVIKRAAVNAGIGSIVIDEKHPLDSLLDWVNGQPDNSLVLLIDEYDVPLTSQMNNHELFYQVREEFANFYFGIKENSGKFRFCFLTGILRFRQTSIFSAFNNLIDISFNPRYGTLLGYTEEEIRTYFADYLVEAAGILKTDVDSLMTKLNDYYDGFCFDTLSSTHVFAPWSVLNFFKCPELGLVNYWYESAGSPRMLREFIKAHPSLDWETLEGRKRIPFSRLSVSDSPEQLSPESVLYQTGYYTIDKVDGNDVLLRYSNREVEYALSELYFSMTYKQSGNAGEIASRLVNGMKNGDVDTVLESFNAAIASIDYGNFPLNSETMARTAIQFLIFGTGHTPQIEQHGRFGRSDLEVATGGYYWVFEFKFAESDDLADGLIAEAVGQIRDRDYGASVLGYKRLRYGLVYSAESRKFIAMQSAD